SVTANPTVTTTYTVTATITATSCVNTGTIVVTVNPLPVVGTTTPDDVLCLGESTTITGTGANTYTWSPSTGLSSTTGTIVTANPSTTTTYTVTGTDGNGCVNTATRVITVNPLPIITGNASPNAICIGGTSNLTASGGVSYTWSPATGLSSTTGTVVAANPTTSTTYTITGTDGNGCVNTGTVSLTVNPLPVVSVSSPDPVLCLGESATLNASVSNGASTFSWSPATGLSSTTGASVTANPTVTTTYTVTATITATSCVNTATIEVTVNPLPVVFITTPDSTLCPAQTTDLTGNGAVTYSWSPAGSLSATTGTMVTASPTVNTTYTVIGTDANGCQSSDEIQVSINSLPTIIASTPNPSICIGSSTTLIASGGISYVWNPGNLTGDTVTVTPLATTTYTVTGTDTNGCSNVATVSINVNSTPALTLNSPDSILCLGETATINAIVTNGPATFVWTPATGLSSTTGTPVFSSPSSTTTYTVTATSTSTGCTTTLTTIIVVNPLPQFSVSTPDSTLCPGQTTTITVTGNNTYTWSPATGLNTTTGNSVVADPVVSTTYTITGTDVNGCSTTVQQIITRNPNPIIVATTPDASLCLNESVTLYASGADVYSWSPANAIVSSAGDSAIVRPTTTTTFTVFGTDVNGCLGQDTLQIFVNNLPTITVNNGTICAGSPIQLTANGANTYQWSPTNSLNDSTSTTVTATPTVTTTYTVTGTVTLTGCSNSATAVVTVNPLPNVNAGPDVTVCVGDPAVSFGVADTFQTYQWATIDGQFLSNLDSVTVNQEGQYVITATDNRG
ncbi:MAG: hypothetical protein NZ108_05970, partial [Bacteroidia bacterium]|nr:hypothetical protein [Bacteroidia bacterium]